jgi:hypothetical protein
VPTSALLGGLLIKFFRLFAQFDSEEGLHAGVEVESFAGPAWSDGSGVGMLEAVDFSELIVGLPAAAKCEVEVPG